MPQGNVIIRALITLERIFTNKEGQVSALGAEIGITTLFAGLHVATIATGIRFGVADLTRKFFAVHLMHLNLIIRTTDGGMAAALDGAEVIYNLGADETDMPDGAFVTTTYGHWTPGESPYIVSARLKLEELDAMAEAMKKEGGEGRGE